MNTSLRKKLIISTGLCVALIMAGCNMPLKLKYKTAPEPEPKQKVYQSVSSSKLGNVSFAVDYFEKDIETNTDFLMMLPQAAAWTPRGHNTTAWVSVQTTNSIGLVIPKKSKCANDLLEVKAGQATIHVWGTVYKARYPGIASVIIVDKCEAKKKSYGRSVM